MPKQYEYNVVLTEEYSRNPFIKRVTLILDHEITSEDQANLEKEYSSRGIIGTSYIVTFYKLQKEFGDFTYNVVYQTKEFGAWVTSSSIYTQDHKHTSKSAKADFKEFVRFLYPSNSAVAPINWSY